MSIQLMTMAWEAKLAPGPKLVLLTLCDLADNHGRHCHPSIAYLAKRSGMSERTAQRTVRELEQEGFLVVVANHFGGAPGSSRVYQVSVDRLRLGTDDKLDETGDKLTPVGDKLDTKLPEQMALVGENQRETGDKLTPNPKSKSKSKSFTPYIPLVTLPDVVPVEVWQLWDEYRKRLSGAAWTRHAMTLSARKLEALHAEGYAAQSVVEQSIERGWTGLFPVRGDALPRTGGHFNRQTALEESNRRIGEAWVPPEFRHAAK